MMKRILTHTFLIFCYTIHFHAAAQAPYGNEWIDYGRPYLRIPIVETGFYLITGEELAGLGIPVDSMPTASIQIFRQGRETAIEATGQLSGIFGRDGRLVFYGERNDGHGDTGLYTSPSAMPHSYYGLYTDSTAYFLTWRTDGGAGVRVPGSPSGPTAAAIDFHSAESLQLFTSHYLPGKFYPPESNFENGSVLTAYDEGEGWTGPEIAENTPYEITWITKDLTWERSSGVDAEILIAGWAPGTHAFTLWSGDKGHLKRKLADITVKGRLTQKVSVKPEPADFENPDKLVLTLMPAHAGGHVSISYALLRYPQVGTFESTQRQKTFHFDNTDRVFNPKELPSGIVWYDVSDPFLVRKLVRNNAGIALTGARKIVGVRETFKIPTPRLVRFSRIASDTDYLIITHPLMRTPVNGQDPVDAYARYRSSKAGGYFKPAVINCHELFDQFNGGQPGPQGIRNAIRWVHEKANLKFVLLAGQSIDPQKARKMANSWQTDMVPNAGWPGSDVALATQDFPADFYPIVPIGRINAPTSKHLFDYLEKVKAMEAEPPSASWRKQLLHLSGGRSKDELNAFRGYMKSFAKKLDGSAVAAQIITRSKLTDNAVETVPIDRLINQGVALVTVFGHSAPDVTDVDIGFASDPLRNYMNAPRLPAILINGCASGSIFYSRKTLSSDWIFNPGNGAVLFLAHTFNGSSTSLKRYTDIFYEVLADPAFTSEPFGTIQREAIRRNMLREPTILDSITVQQMTLHGDPAIRIFPARLPDYAIDDRSVIVSPEPRKPGVQADSLRIGLVVKNNGRYRLETLRIMFTRILDGVTTHYPDRIRPAAAIADTIFFSIPGNIGDPKQEQWRFQLDPEQELTEENEENNTLTIKPADILQSPDTDYIAPALIVTVDGRQLRRGEVVSEYPIINLQMFDDSLPTLPNDTTVVAIWLRQQCEGCTDKRIGLKNLKGQKTEEQSYQMELMLPFPLTPGPYTLTVQCRDLASNLASPYQIDFTVNVQPGIVSVSVSPNPSGDWFRFSLDLQGPVRQNFILSVTNSSGTMVFQKLLTPHIGLNEWIWTPGALPAGSYHYKISPDQSAGTMLPDIPEGAQGHLHYVH
nr:C25 family cysteine peptidase [uncultured Dyadobacter sp.]